MTITFKYNYKYDDLVRAYSMLDSYLFSPYVDSTFLFDDESNCYWFYNLDKNSNNLSAAFIEFFEQYQPDFIRYGYISKSKVNDDILNKATRSNEDILNGMDGIHGQVQTYGPLAQMFRDLIDEEKKSIRLIKMSRYSSDDLIRHLI